MFTKLTLGHWRTAIEGAATELATRALALTSVVLADPIGLERTASMIGAHIPMIGGGQAFEMALVASPEGCEALSRAILGRNSGSRLRDADVADATGEIVNMLAGATKRRLARHGAELTLGLPIFIHGYIEPTDRLSVVAMPLRFGAIETVVIVVGDRS